MQGGERVNFTENVKVGWGDNKVGEQFKKGVFTSDDSLVKLVYLAYRNIRKKWTMPLANGNVYFLSQIPLRGAHSKSTKSDSKTT